MNLNQELNTREMRAEIVFLEVGVCILKMQVMVKKLKFIPSLQAHQAGAYPGFSGYVHHRC